MRKQFFGNNVISLGLLDHETVSPVKSMPFSQIYDQQECRDKVQQDLYDQKPVNFRNIKKNKQKKKENLGFQNQIIVEISDDESDCDK